MKLTQAGATKLFKMIEALVPEYEAREDYEIRLERDAAFAKQELVKEASHTKVENDANNEDVSFRMEVIEELIAAGFARNVAANLTNTEAKLMSKAREIGYI